MYAPTLGTEKEDTNEFYRILEKIIQKEREYYNIVMGDWNAKKGQSREVKGVSGTFGIGEQNINGERMIECVSRHRLKIANSFFPKKN